MQFYRSGIIIEPYICLQQSLVTFDYDDRPRKIEPPHDKTKKMACAPSEDPPSLIKVFAVRSMVGEDQMFLHSDSEDTDQTGRTGHFVGFVVRRLKYAFATGFS